MLATRARSGNRSLPRRLTSGNSIHLSLNLHRAPGYCITRNELEKHNLWLDVEAQDAFVFLWAGFARRYRGVAAADLSFDLVNEPPAIGLNGFSCENHAALIRRTVAAVRAIDPDRPIVIDGLDLADIVRRVGRHRGGRGR